MKTWRVLIIHHLTTQKLFVQARHHEEAEREALLRAHVKWEHIQQIITEAL